MIHCLQSNSRDSSSMRTHQIVVVIGVVVVIEEIVDLTTGGLSVAVSLYTRLDEPRH